MPGAYACLSLDGRGHTLAAWGGVALIAVQFLLTLASGRWGDTALVGGCLAASVGYLTLERQQPRVIGLVVVLAALANTAGWGGQLLDSVWFFDDLLHLTTPLALALALGFRLGQSVGEPLTARPVLLLVLAASLSTSVGVLWELAEWVSNDFQRLEDTLPDLLLNTLGALAGASLAVWLLRHSPAAPEHGRGRTPQRR